MSDKNLDAILKRERDETLRAVAEIVFTLRATSPRKCQRDVLGRLAVELEQLQKERTT